MTSMSMSPAAIGEPSRARVLKAAGTALAFLLAAWLLYLSLRGVDWRSVYVLLSGAKIGFLALGGLLSSLALLLRALRWRVLLQAEGTVRVPDAFWATSAGYFGNNFLPGRAGELVRTFMISSRSNLSAAYVLTTALSERVADAIALVSIGGLVLLTIPVRPGWLAAAAKPVGAIALCGMVLIAILPRLHRWIAIVLEMLPVPGSIRMMLTNLLEQVLLGIRSFHHARRLLMFVALTAAIWSIDATGTIVGGYALGLSISYPMAFLLLAGLGLGSALPSTPGYVGIYQFVAVTVLMPFGLSRSNAIGYILLAQAMSYLVYGIWGFGGLMRYRRAKR